jgi:hypothetical protein
MMLGLVMDIQTYFTLTSLSLLHCLENVLYMLTLFLLLNTFCHASSGLVRLCQELLNILGFDLFTVSMTVVDET